MERRPFHCHTRRIVRPALWLLFALTCAALAAFHVYARFHQITYQERVNEAERRADIARERALELLSNMKLSRSELEHSLNGGKPFDTRIDQNGMQAAIFQELESGTTFRLLFAGQKLLRWQESARSAASRPPVPRAFGAWEWAEATRQYMAALGGPVWLALLIVLALSSRGRRFWTNLLLGVAILCTIAWLLRPNDGWPWALPHRLLFSSHKVRPIPPGVSIDPDFWLQLHWRQQPLPIWHRILVCGLPSSFGLLLILISGSLLFLICRRENVTYPHCSRCGYNLTANASGVCPECGAPTTSCRREGLESKGAGRGNPVIRGLSYALVGGSIVLCLASLLLWARSHLHWDWVDFPTGNYRIKVDSFGGRTELRATEIHTYFGLFDFSRWTCGSTCIAGVKQPQSQSWPGSWGFALASQSRPSRRPFPNERRFLIASPHWFLATVSAIPPLWWLRRRTRSRRRAIAVTPSPTS